MMRAGDHQINLSVLKSKPGGMGAAFLLLALLWSGGAVAAVCTSLSAGGWNTASRWSCGRVPLTTDTVVLAHNITLDQDRTVAGLTINSGIVFNENGKDLTVTGSVINNGTFGVAGGGGRLYMTGAGTTLTGNGAFNDSRLYIDANNISLPAGSTMNFTLDAQIRVGSNSPGSFTVAGTITDTGANSGNRVMRVYNASTLTITGTFNTPNSYLQIRTGGTVMNNGTVALRYLNGDNAASAVWTQGANASLTVTQSAVSWMGTFNASASGNTVTYNGTATPITPSSNTYFNLAGTGVVCPHGFTVLGTNPCAGSSLVSVTLNPSNCVNVTGIGTLAWINPAFAVSSNNAFATISLSDFQTSNYLRCTGYGFAIPVGATISGITVRVERKASNTTVQDAAMRLVRDASGAPAIQTTDRSTTTVYTTVDASEPHGGVADLWGAVWTPADINSVNFGTAFAAKKPGSAGGARTVSVDHMPITVTYTAAAAAPHHIQIDHSGSGQTCRAETLTVKACTNTACTAPYLTTATVTGNVTWSGSPGGTIPFTIASGGTGQTTVSLPVTTAQTVTLGTSSVAPAQTNPPSTCVNSSGGAACSMTFTAASACFDAVETGAAISSNIFTKLSGTLFSLDVLATSSYTGTLQAELVNASTGTCATYPSLSAQQGVVFSNHTRRPVSFTYNNAAKNVRIRITGLAGSSCSTDRFAIRPASLTVTSSANADAVGTNATATPVVKAGAAFTLNATALAGYDGIPVVDNALLSAHTGAVTNGIVSGAFPAANPVTGAAVGSSFDYSEAGYFRLNTAGVYDDSFTAVDQPNDCTNNFSNVLAGGKYGCKFGSVAASNFFGRFVPDHFDVSVTEVALGAGGVEAVCIDDFTYAAQPFVVEVTARNLGSGMTQNYSGNYAKALTLSNANAVPGTLNNTSLAATAFSAGVGTTPNPSSALSPNYSFAAAQTPPVTINLRAAESVGGDDVSSATGVEDTMEIRSGQLALGSAHGSELLGLTIPIETRYWTAGGYYTVNADDTCTMIPASSITMGAYTKNLAACETRLAPIGDLGFDGGALASPLRLSAPGAGNNGSVDLRVTVGTVASGNTCLGATQSAATEAKVPWLTTNTARATFGVYKGADEFIYQRENY